MAPDIDLADDLDPRNSAPQQYADGKPSTKPRMKLLRTLFRIPRSTKQLTPGFSFDPKIDAPHPAIAAQWGEHLLVEDISSVIHRDGTVTWRRRIVTQLHKPEHLAQWDEITRVYDIRREKHAVVAAKLYVPGEKPRSAKRKVHTVSAPGRVANHYGRAVQLQFHPLRPGVIVEFEEVHDDFRVGELGPMLVGEFYLQTGPPCRFRRYTVAAASPFSVQYRLHHGAPAPLERQWGKYHVLTWEAREAPGVEFDDWTPPARDFLPWIDVSTETSWAPFATQLRKELEPGATIATEVRNLARDLSANKTQPIEKACAAYAYAAREVRYGRPPSELSSRDSRPANRVFEDLRGDCKDKSALLVQLLRAMGLQAQIAVVLTADAGRAPYLPGARFNHAIVKLTLGDRAYWLDAASGPFTFGDLPQPNLGVGALVLKGETFHFDRVARSRETAFTDRRVWSGKLSADGTYEARAKIEYSAEASVRLRSSLADRSDEGQTSLLQTWLGSDYPGATGSDFHLDGIEDLSQSVRCECAVRVERIARPVKNILLLQPPWSGATSMTGPFAASDRRQPLAVPALYHTYEEHSIELSPGVTPFAVADPVTAACDWGRYSCATVVEGNRLVCRREFELFGRPAPADRFAEFKNFYQQCSWSDDATIVLRAES